MPLTVEEEVAALQGRYLGAVQEELRRVVPQARGSGGVDIHALLRHFLGWEEADGQPSHSEGGKALRPVLCLMACELAGGDWRKALPAATSLELTHNFSLIHDDIQDSDTTRRGRPTTWSVWGVPKAVAAGNAMRVLADEAVLALQEMGVPAAITLDASLMLTSRYMEMIEGQYMDIAFEGSKDVTTSDYLDMIGRKTGALIESSMYVGALVATQDVRVAEAFGRCGRLLGLAFQVRDDYLGIWGNPATIGKPVGSDIRRKKKSLPVVHVFQKSSGKDGDRLLQIYSAPQVAWPDVETVLELMDAAGTGAYVQETAEAQGRAALEPLEEMGLPAEAFRQVQAMARYFVTREK